MTRTQVEKLISDIIKIREIATDFQASVTTNLYPKLKRDWTFIKAGTRINHNGTIKRAAVDLYDTAENSPDNAPTLWEDIEYKEGYRKIPEIITQGTAFAKDELGWWEGKLYKSLIEINVWTPTAFPSGWEEVEQYK